MNRFRLPYHLKIEEGILNNVPDCMKDVFPDLKNAKTIIVTTEHLMGLFPDIVDEFRKDFPAHELFLAEERDYDSAVDLAKQIVMKDAKLVIALGGGSLLDFAKFAAFVSKAKLISVPTALSNDSLASPVAVLGTEGKARKSLRCTIPDAIIVDLDVVKQTPVNQLLAGIGDTLSKYTALYDWKLAGRKTGEAVDDFACMISHMAFESILFNTSDDLADPDFIRRLTDALVMGGLAMEIAGCSRPCSGSEHLFAHALDEEFADQVSLPHGIATAMGTYPASIFQGQNSEKVLKVIRQYGLPVSPSANGVSEDIFVGAWQKAAATRADRYSILNETDLSTSRLQEIYAQMEEELA